MQVEEIQSNNIYAGNWKGLLQKEDSGSSKELGDYIQRVTIKHQNVPYFSVMIQEYN